MLFRVILFIAVHLLTGFSSSATNTPSYVVLEENNLPDELTETSGLYCPEVGSAYTVNDSGNSPIIYKIDHAGDIVTESVIATKNRDWEALTGDRQYFYVGDVGNNNGKRKFVEIHAVSKHKNNESNDVKTLKIFYVNNSLKSNQYLNHDFDAETLVNLDDSLFLFSKSWKTGSLFIYQLNKIDSEQFVKHVAEVDGLPGIVTGGDYDSKNHRFILVGYEIKGIGRFNPFIAILNRDLTLHQFFDIPGYRQVEGICVTPNGEVWFTQEGSFLSNNKLVKLKVAK